MAQPSSMGLEPPFPVSNSRLVETRSNAGEHGTDEAGGHAHNALDAVSNGQLKQLLRHGAALGKAPNINGPMGASSAMSFSN